MSEKIIIILFILLAFISKVSGSEKIVKLATHESPPYTGSNLKNKGVITEIVVRAFEYAGYKTDIEVVPWKRGLERTKQGVYDGLFGCWYRKEREEWFIYSEPMIANELVFLKRKGTNILFDGDYSSLKSYNIGYIRGYAYPPGIESVKDSLKIEMVTKNIQNLMKLARGRIDLAMIDRLLARYLIATEMIGFSDAFEEIDFLLARDPNHLVFSKKAKDIQSKTDAFDKGLEYLKKERIIEEILRKHGF